MRWFGDDDDEVNVLTFGKLVCIIANFASLVACLALLYKFFRMRSEAWKRLFPRQLWNLALADILYSTATIVNYCSWAIVPQVHKSAQDIVCQGVVGALLSGMYVSAFVEAHIAVGFACIYWRQLRVLSFLNTTLLLVWPVGIALGVIQSVMVVDFNEAVDNYQSCRMTEGVWEWAEATILLTAFMVSMLAYVAAARRVRQHDPDSVQRAVWKTTWVYPLNFCITYFPLIVYLLPIAATRTKAVFYVAVVLEGLNGVINAGCYAFTSRYARHQFQRSSSGNVRGTAARLAAQKALGVDNCLEDPLDANSVLDNLVAFHVGFRSNDSFIDVPCTQRAALKRSERDMAAISAGKIADAEEDEESVSPSGDISY